MMRTRTAAFLAAVLAAPVVTEATGLAAPCHAQTLTIQGQAIKANFCVIGVQRQHTGAGEVARVTLTESLSGTRGSVERTATKDVLLAGSDGRLSDDVPLRPLGIEKTLHVTFVFHDGTVVPESALLIPGAVPVL